jgi:hypothetical protein
MLSTVESRAGEGRLVGAVKASISTIRSARPPRQFPRNTSSPLRKECLEPDSLPSMETKLIGLYYTATFRTTDKSDGFVFMRLDEKRLASLFLTRQPRRRRPRFAPSLTRMSHVTLSFLLTTNPKAACTAIPPCKREASCSHCGLSTYLNSGQETRRHEEDPLPASQHFHAIEGGLARRSHIESVHFEGFRSVPHRSKTETA